jgi:hypothetical protein
MVCNTIVLYCNKKKYKPQHFVILAMLWAGLETTFWKLQHVALIKGCSGSNAI